MPAGLLLNFFNWRAAWTSSGSILLLLSISGLSILGLVFLAAIWAGAESDAAALDRQRNLVTSRLQDQVQRVGHDVQLIGAGYGSLLSADADEVDGDATNHGTRANTSTETFGKIATTVFGYNAAFIVRGDGELALNSDPDAVRRYRWVRPLLQPLLLKIEAEMPGTSSDAASSAERSTVALMRLEGRPSIAGVVSIPDLPSPKDTLRRTGEPLYLIVFRFLDGTTLDRISREQGLSGARYSRTQDQEQSEVAFQIEATATGEPIGFIIWQPDLPGSRVIGRLVPVLSVAGVIIVALFFALMARLRRSMTELSASEQHARHLSGHDVLTGVPNRALFVKRLEECLLSTAARSRPKALALIDLDRFKAVNDTHGHPAGDELLRNAVSRMKLLIGSDDTLARLGGDEFALLFPNFDPDGSHSAVVKNIIDDLSRPFSLSGVNAVVQIGCSIGLAVFEDGKVGTDEILRRADLALYDAKTHGRGRVVAYDPSLDDRIDAREILKTHLRIVLQQHELEASSETDDLPDVGELEVFYQSVHRSDGTEDLSGAEALVRWRHPSHGILSPDKFIPIAEEAGLIDRIGRWVLKNSAATASRWPQHISLAVNVSPSQIKRKDFDTQVLSVLSETGLQPSRLELEVTEAALFDIDSDAQAALSRLRSVGVKIALDDFGTGFSSLSHLIRLNIDRIKIDRSFVQLLGSQAEGAAIVSAILGLSRTLGKATTAEGVETDGQRDFLVSAGCTDLQGFLFSRPMPLDEFENRFVFPTARGPSLAVERR